MERPDSRHHPLQPVVQARTVLGFGLLLALALAIGLGYWVVSDRRHRLDAAERQSQALAAGVGRVINLELRNIERAMHGIAGDAQQLLETEMQRLESYDWVYGSTPPFSHTVRTERHTARIAVGAGLVQSIDVVPEATAAAVLAGARYSAGLVDTLLRILSAIESGTNEE